MRSVWNKSSGVDARVEQWLIKRHEARVMSGDVTSSAPCPEQSFLDALARKSKSVSLSDPRVDHVAKCSKCMIRLRESDATVVGFRRSVKLATVLGAWAALAFAIILGGRHYFHWSVPNSNLVAVSETIDLTGSATTRGEQSTDHQFPLLPAKLIKLTVILPRLSPAGRYEIAISGDQLVAHAITTGYASATTLGQNEAVITDLELSNASPGVYFLSTTHEPDQVSYYYSVRIH